MSKSIVNNLKVLTSKLTGISVEDLPPCQCIADALQVLTDNLNAEETAIDVPVIVIGDTTYNGQFSLNRDTLWGLQDGKTYEVKYEQTLNGATTVETLTGTAAVVSDSTRIRLEVLKTIENSNYEITFIDNAYLTENIQVIDEAGKSCIAALADGTDAAQGFTAFRIISLKEVA